VCVSALNQPPRDLISPLWPSFSNGTILVVFKLSF
jgi:hypothetical protein